MPFSLEETRSTSNTMPRPSHTSEDEYLFGWDTTPGIVSVWANREGRAIVWRRINGDVTYTTEHFRPWLFATTLADLSHLGPALRESTIPGAETAFINYRILNSPLLSEARRASVVAVVDKNRDGPEDSYRYLLTARDGRALERAIVTGASRRLKRQIASLNELQDEYYRVGPVEQYLMQSGRVYFQGMTYHDLHRLQFDLETTALDPHRGRIFLVAVRDNRGLATTLEAPAPGDEAALITRLCAIIRDRDPDVIENHNLFGFDLPFLEQRATTHGLTLLLGREGGPMTLERREETLAIGPEARRRTRYSLAGRELIDTMDAVRRHDFVVRDMPSYRLKDVARYFGIAPPDRVYLEGTAIFETYRRDPELVRHYAQDDVIEVDGLSRQLLGAPFALASMAPRRYERLASAGPAMGILEPILVRAYLRAGAALPGSGHDQNGGNGLHEGGAVHLFAEGVARQVVKADVASLYPSLMRTFQIGPACDRLGVLLNVLSRLTDLRLSHKAAARRAPPGSEEANAHDATQAAMKILINAAYGYMGAGQMALFADSHAAGEVTRQGRAILTQVLEALRQRGMALIEADTDGVYFAAPSGWSEEQERTLVDEIGAGLPAGIRLEYEGRYRAMLSHEVKNYALLTYDGRLIVRGVALRSSRAEPFGERFLRQAILCTMTNDIPGLRQAYLETVGALRHRSLSPADVAARVRLSKTPEAYLASRPTHPEPAYEALLAAGRTQWYPGERVRFYRTRGKKYVWLPDETEDASVDRGWAGANGQDKDESSYDINHYLQALITSYAARLRKAFTPEDFSQLFRLEGQTGLFDRPIEDIQPRWIQCA